MNFPANKQGDHHQVDHHMASYNMTCTCKCYVERDSLKVSKAEVDNLYSRARAEILDNENLLKTYQKSYDSIGKKYQDALDRIDHMSNNPNVTSNLFDNLHNEIDDRDTMVARLHTEVEAQKESLDRARRDAGRAIRQLNDRRLVGQGSN